MSCTQAAFPQSPPGYPADLPTSFPRSARTLSPGYRAPSTAPALSHARSLPSHLHLPCPRKLSTSNAVTAERRSPSPHLPICGARYRGVAPGCRAPLLCLRSHANAPAASFLLNAPPPPAHRPAPGPARPGEKSLNW